MHIEYQRMCEIYGRPAQYLTANIRTACNYEADAWTGAASDSVIELRKVPGDWAATLGFWLSRTRFPQKLLAGRLSS